MLLFDPGLLILQALPTELLIFSTQDVLVLLIIKLMNLKFDLNEYNMSRADGGMDLVLFTYCIEHIIRVCRCLSQRGGNALLVGVGGSGRKSVTALASFISNQKLEQIELTKR